jgi:hypothetical protein
MSCGARTIISAEIESGRRLRYPAENEMSSPNVPGRKKNNKKKKPFEPSK